MKNPGETLLRLLNEKDDVFTREWKGKIFEKIKVISTTEKGDIGEDFLAELLKSIGCKHVEIIKGRRGHYDVSFVEDGGKSAVVKFEVKVATRDTNDSFQFNGIRYETRYTHLFCLGVTPEEVYYLIVPKQNLDNYNLVPMARGTNATFKLTRTVQDMKHFDSFEDDIKGITLT